MEYAKADPEDTLIRISVHNRGPEGAQIHVLPTLWFRNTWSWGDDETKPSDKKKVMILGGGPNRIGQGIEFDYCCVHAAFALKEDGFETLMVNSNPETVSTDYDTSDKLYYEPLTLEDVPHIY